MTDTEEVELALVDWVNACYPDAEAEEFDDLADGSILAEVLQLYAPDVDPSNTAAGSAKLLHGRLNAHFGPRLSLPRLAGNMHNGAFCKPGLLRALCEAVMLAAVEGPRKEEAIKAIMNLDEPQQLALGSALQRLMAEASQHDEQPGSLSRQGTDASMPDSGPPTPRADQTVYKSEADVLQDELQEMRDRLNSEEMAISGLESSHKSLEAQLRGVMNDYAAEEEQAAETDALLQKWQRSHGEDLRQFKAECDALRMDLHRETENWQDLPQRESKLRKQLKMEVDASRDLQDKTGNLEVEIRQAAQANANDDVSTVKAEMMTSQMQQNVVDRLLRRAETEEKDEMRLAKSLWEALHVAEVTAQAKEDSFRQLRRIAEKEEESELDVVGLLEFRESEMRQLEQAIAEMDSGPAPGQHRASVTEGRASFTKRSSIRASIMGPPGAGAAELLRSLPDLQERRLLLKELAKTSRAQSTWQAELQQQQQRTRELEYRLQQLSDEASTLHSSEAKALTELGMRRQEEQRCAAELRERDHLVQAEVRRANLEKDQMNGVRRTGQQTADLQRELVVARSELQSLQAANDEKSQQLSDLMEETAATEAESAQIRERNEEHTRALVSRQAQSSSLKMQSEAAAEELQRAQQSLLDLRQQRELAASRDEESTRLQALQQRLSTEQQCIEEQAQRLEAHRQQLQSHKAALQAQREALEASKRKKAESRAQSRTSRNLQEALAAEQALAKEPTPHAVEGKVAEDKAASAAIASSAATEAQAPQPSQQSNEQRAATAARASTAAAAAAAAANARTELKPHSDQVQSAASTTGASRGVSKREDEPEPPSTKSGKAALKKLRLQLAAQEGKMRQADAASAERQEAMRRETQLLADSLREVGLRCHMLLGKHKMLLDDRKRLESEA